MPIEGWPAFYQRRPRAAPPTLDDVQRDKPGNAAATATPSWSIRSTGCSTSSSCSEGPTTAGQAAQASIFDLKTNKLRPDGWTSADAAGLPIFPAVVRYDELQRGIVEHAMRVTVRKHAPAYVRPGHALRQPLTRTPTTRAWASGSV